MRVDVQPRLLEEAVFRALHARGSDAARLADGYHRERDAVYELSCTDEERAARFAEIAAEAFARLGLERLLRAATSEQPLLEASLSRMTFAFVDSRKREGAEMLVRDGARRVSAADREGLVAIRAERFEDPEALKNWLRRELLHIADMVDPAFGYEPELRADGAAQLNLMRDRYEVVWDAWVDVRLARRGWLKDKLDSYLPAFGRAFRGLGHDALHILVERLRNSPALTHRELSDWAAGRVATH